MRKPCARSADSTENPWLSPETPAPVTPLVGVSVNAAEPLRWARVARLGGTPLLGDRVGDNMPDVVDRAMRNGAARCRRLTLTHETVNASTATSAVVATARPAVRPLILRSSNRIRNLSYVITITPAD